MQIGDTIEGKIEAIAFGGAGIMRHKGCVVFVPHTLIGERVKVKVSSLKKKFAWAGLIEIVEMSPSRVKADCEHFGSCGGCQFQHMKYEEQIISKKKFIEDALLRIGKIDKKLDNFIEASILFNYRKRIRLKITPKGIGYITDDFNFLPISSCILFHKKEDPIICTITDFVARHSLTGHVTFFKAEKYILFFEIAGIPNVSSLSLPHNIQGVILKSEKKEIVLGNVNTEIRILGTTFHCSALSFIQNHTHQSEKLYACILSIIEKIEKRGLILDLYCGFGILSTLSFKKFGSSIIGVECNEASIALAQRNCQDVQFICAFVETVLPKLLKKKPNLIIVNPPRGGLSSVVLQMLLQANVENIIYISCMPATLARDLKLFVENGYILMTCIGCDMFPQTSHVETIAYLQRTSG